MLSCSSLSKKKSKDIDNFAAEVCRHIQPESGRTSVLQHDIVVDSPNAIHTLPFIKLPMKSKKKVQAEVTHLYEQGIIEPSHTSSIVPVSKLVNSVRMCVGQMLLLWQYALSSSCVGANFLWLLSSAFDGAGKHQTY